MANNKSRDKRFQMRLALIVIISALLIAQIPVIHAQAAASSQTGIEQTAEETPAPTDQIICPAAEANKVLLVIAPLDNSDQTTQSASNGQVQQIQQALIGSSAATV